MTLQCFYALSTQKLQMIFSIVAKYSESPSAKPSFLLQEQNKMEWWMDRGVCCKCFSTFLYAWHCSKILRVGKTCPTIQMFNSKKREALKFSCGPHNGHLIPCVRPKQLNQNLKNETWESVSRAARHLINTLNRKLTFWIYQPSWGVKCSSLNHCVLKWNSF